MSDKKRIEAIKGVFFGQVYNINKAVTFDREDANWLIQQAERVQELERIAQKSGELNVFLQGRMKGRWGDNVIDIAMDLIAEQEKENARLREALEEIAKESGTPYARTAKAALEGGTEFYTNELWTKQVQHWMGQSGSDAPK